MSPDRLTCICSRCGTFVGVPQNLAGESFQCPNCGKWATARKVENPKGPGIFGGASLFGGKSGHGGDAGGIGNAPEWHLSKPMGPSDEPRITETPVMAHVVRLLGIVAAAISVLATFAQRNIIYLAGGLGILCGCLIIAELIFLVHAIAVDTRVMRWRAEKKELDSGVEGG